MSILTLGKSSCHRSYVATGKGRLKIMSADSIPVVTMAGDGRLINRQRLVVVTDQGCLTPPVSQTRLLHSGFRLLQLLCVLKRRLFFVVIVSSLHSSRDYRMVVGYSLFVVVCASLSLFRMQGFYMLLHIPFDIPSTYLNIPSACLNIPSQYQHCSISDVRKHCCLRSNSSVGFSSVLASLGVSLHLYNIQ